MFTPKHRHHFETIGMAHDRDYEHPDCYDDLGNRKVVNGGPALWGKPYTYWTLRCLECGDISYRRVEGHMVYLGQTPHPEDRVQFESL